MHEDNFLSSWLREDLRRKEELERWREEAKQESISGKREVRRV